jgi:hypothetical protein
MKECIDEGTLQAYFDGELGRETAAAVASHLASCPNCAEAARLVENENLLLSEALESEFAENIPTEHLRERVDAAISADQIARPSVPTAQGWWESIRNFVFPAPQRAFGYAGLAAVIILSAIFAVVYLRRNSGSPVAQNESPKQTPLITSGPLPASSPVSSPGSPSPGSTTNEHPVIPVAAQPKLAGRKSTRPNTTDAGLLPGERNYVKTIATLNANIKSDKPMRPALRVEYEHNLAVLDSAIEVTRDAARKNPRDRQAAQFMLAAYQSKVELLNQVADARLFNTEK